MRAIEFITGHMVYNLAYTFTDDSHPGQKQGCTSKITMFEKKPYTKFAQHCKTLQIFAVKKTVSQEL